MSIQHRALLCLLQLIFVLITVTKSNPIRNEPDWPCKPPHFNSYPFCNPSLSSSTRAKSLISLLTLQEKIQQLSDNASAISRLGIPAYEWWSESLHGIATNGPGVSFNGTVSSSTSFPQVLVSSASFNRSLWSKIGSAVAVEARAMYNLGQAGLTFWAPNINIFRDPRWGRGQETPGEDPMVVSAYAVEYVKSFQGKNWEINGGDGGFGFGFGEKRALKGVDEDNDDGLMLSACCKHLIAYDLEEWMNFSRYSFNAMVTEQDMEDTFQPPFRSCIEQGRASCIMCSYNQVNGVPACLRGDLFQKARDEWGFKGYITSDCDAVATIYEYQNYTKTPEDSAADVLKAGMDTNCGTYMLQHTQSAIDQGKVREEEIDRALFNLFSVQLRLGLFDGDPRKGKFGKLGAQHVCTTEHKKLALDAARQGIVLLKNDKKFLPLNKNAVSSLAIIGPLANNISQMGGGYTGIPCSPKSLFQGLKAYVSKTYYASGCRDISCNSDAWFSEAVHTAKKADIVIVVAGLDLTQETEDLDRVSLLLPGQQMSLVTSVARASKKPVILVLTGGGPLDISFAVADPQVSSILWIGYPGEAGAKALAEIIFGHFNPGERLPMTWYPESFTKVPMNDMNMRADPSRHYPGRTYRFYTGKQVYGFGHGLSYTNYSYKFSSAPSKLSISASFKTSSSKNILQHRGSRVDHIHIDEVISCTSLRFYVQISVMNSGDMDGSHVVLLFAILPKVFRGTPEKQLIGFDRVHTLANVSKEISILVDPREQLSIANEHGKRILPLGKHVQMVGDLEHFLSVETY